MATHVSDGLPQPGLCIRGRSGYTDRAHTMDHREPSAGVCLARTFAIVVAEQNPGITVGLIPCAAGGSPIATWEPGGYWEQTDSHPYDDAIRRARAAMESGELKGMLWHQGESDAQPELADVYEEGLHGLIQRLRTELQAPHVPFIAGQLGQFTTRPWDELRRKVNAAHEALPKHIASSAFVTSEGLTHKGDDVHFDSPSLRELGRRYAAAYAKLVSCHGSSVDRVAGRL